MPLLIHALFPVPVKNTCAASTTMWEFHHPHQRVHAPARLPALVLGLVVLPYSYQRSNVLVIDGGYRRHRRLAAATSGDAQVVPTRHILGSGLSSTENGVLQILLKRLVNLTDPHGKFRDLGDGSSDTAGKVLETTPRMLGSRTE